MLENGKIVKSSIFLRGLYIFLGIILVYLIHSDLFSKFAEGSIGFYIQLVLITAPLGLISLIISMFAKGYASGNSMGAIFLTCLMFVAGYIQWFYLIPRFFYKSIVYKKVSNLKNYAKLRMVSFVIISLLLLIFIVNALINLIGAL